MERKATRVAYGEHLVELGKRDNRIVVFDADLAVTTNTEKFHKVFPDRFFDCGIAEANMMDMAAGISTMGFIPFASTFAVFGTGRAFEIIRNGIAYPKFNVKLAFTHAGISVGEDGGSHQSIEDIALMREIPGMTVLVPADANETVKAMDAAVSINGPVYIRLSRLASEVFEDQPFDLNRANVLREGEDVVIFCCGLMVEQCLKAADILHNNGISTAIINVHTIKPLDEKTVLKYTRKCDKVVTVEEASILGGLGDAVAAVACGKSKFKFKKIGLDDCFGQSGSAEELFEEYGLTSKQIAETIKKM